MAGPGGQPQSGTDKPLRVGVIGLGKRWRGCYRAALYDRFALAAVCDPVAALAAREARQLGCGLAAGPTELLERPDVDALLLLDRPWFGLWPVEAACRLAKPVLCALNPACDEAHADRLSELIEQSSLPVMVALSGPFQPELIRLRELLTEQLGAPRLLLGSRTTCHGRRRASAAACGSPLNEVGGFSRLFSWCDSLLEGTPRRFLAASSAEGGMSSILLDYAEGRAAQLSRVRTSAGRSSWRIEVHAEHGVAVAGPGRVSWHSSAGRFTQVLNPARPAVRLLLESFRKALAVGLPPRPSFADAHRLLCWMRLAARSQAEKGWVNAPGE
jgi:hypothetical protein